MACLCLEGFSLFCALTLIYSKDSKIKKRTMSFLKELCAFSKSAIINDSMYLSVFPMFPVKPIEGNFPFKNVKET